MPAIPRRLLALAPLLLLAGRAERFATIRSHAAAPAPEGGASGRRGGARRWFTSAAALIAASRAGVAQAKEVVAANERFHHELDKNSDGIVGHDEFMAIIPPPGGEIVDEIRDRLVDLYERIFKRADIVGDGRLTPGELTYAEYLAADAMNHNALFLAADAPPYDFGEASLVELMKDMDEDEDGKINANEYTKAIHGAARSWGWGDDVAEDPELLEWTTHLWNLADIDGDGVLNPRELQFAAFVFDHSTNHGLWLEKVLARQVADLMWQDLDTDRDGRISAEELLHGSRSDPSAEGDARPPLPLHAELLKDEVARAENEAQEAVEDKGETTEVGSTSADRLDGRVRKLFQTFDADGDGSLDVAEVDKLTRHIVSADEEAEL